jgi:hypothetical protein
MTWMLADVGYQIVDERGGGMDRARIQNCVQECFASGRGWRASVDGIKGR